MQRIVPHVSYQIWSHIRGGSLKLESTTTEGPKSLQKGVGKTACGYRGLERAARQRLSVIAVQQTFYAFFFFKRDNRLIKGQKKMQ